MSEKSYIEGFCPSQADVAVSRPRSGAPDAGKFAHAARWYAHIASYAGEFSSLPGERRLLPSTVPS